MASSDKLKTEKHDLRQLSDLIKANCEKFHQSSELSDSPWFMDKKNSATPVLAKLLAQSSHNASEFSDLAAKKVLDYKEIETSFNLSKVSHLKESLDIEDALAVVNSMQNSSTMVHLHVKKSQSFKGPLSIKLKLQGGKENVLEEGDDASFVLGLNDSVPVEFFLDDGNQTMVIESEVLNASKVIGGTYYLSAVQKPELKSEIHKKGPDYEVIIQIKLKLSVKDKREILLKRSHEVEKVLNETNQDIVVYNDLMASLCIYFDEHDQCFNSLVRKRKEREGCCEDCILF